MLFSIITSVFALFPVAKVLGSQVPFVDGVLGGVPKKPPQVQLEAASIAATTPHNGTLHGVVENSGICGEYIINQSSRSCTCLLTILHCSRDDSGCVSSVWVWGCHWQWG
jgi:hypothetical protein